VARILVSAGHEVFGTTRRSDRVHQLDAVGVVGIVMDALDRESVGRAIGASAPDAVVHQLTDLSGSDFAGNARLREEGTANLVDAARDGGVTRMVAQSISWAYEPGAVPATEDEPLARDPATGLPRFASIETLEHSVLSLPHGVVLRYGLFYGPGTWYAADGTVAALGWPPGVVNVVDDDPTHVDEWGPLYVEAAGGTVASITARADGRSADNSRARALGWVPEHRSWRASLLGTR
jgi:nucleoside-diphosphate-sugar epimerase